MLKKDILIPQTATVKEALKKLDKTAEKVLLVIDTDELFLGTITDGDIRRYLLNNGTLEQTIEVVFNKNPKFIYEDDFSLEVGKKILLEKKVELIPILDRANRVVDYLSWDQALASHGLRRRESGANLKIPVIIMAGGKGTRLEPFTSILPKPLIPIGDKTIIEVIIDEFRNHGISSFFFTINYKGEMIEAYFNGIPKDYSITYLREKDFCGTAGSLKLAEQVIDDVFIVSNCDVIVRADFEEVVRLHKEKNAYMTIFSSIQHYKLPYGVVSFENGGIVKDIIEKPEYTFTVNTGVYILDKKCLQFIPGDSNFDMPDLIRALIDNQKLVITYPVNENEYIDTGQWDEYKRAVQKLGGM